LGNSFRGLRRTELYKNNITLIAKARSHDGKLAKLAEGAQNSGKTEPQNSV
jgi:hypothetical protein